MSSAGRGAGVTVVRGKRHRTPTRMRRHAWSPRCSGLRRPLRGRRLPAQNARQGKPARQPPFLQSQRKRRASPSRVRSRRACRPWRLRAAAGQIIRYEKRWLLSGRRLRLPTRSRWLRPAALHSGKRANPCKQRLRQL